MLRDLEMPRREPLWQRGMRRAVLALDRLGALDRLSGLLSRRPRRSLVVLTYHRVWDEGTELDPGVISASTAAFAAQLRLIAAHGQSVSIPQVIAALDGQAELPDQAVLVTFDDGYRDNCALALPLLVQHGVRATFFVTSGFIGSGKLPWWDRLGYVLRRAQVEALHLRYPLPLSLPLGQGPQAPERAAALRVLLRLIKQVYRLDHARFFAEVEAAAAVAVDEAALARGLFMGWDEVRRLRDAGMDIGAHTHTHRVLQTLGLAEAQDELVRPRAILAAELGAAPRAIAYPVGLPLSVALRAQVAAAGYEVGFIFRKGFWRLGGAPPDRFNLPRFAVEPAPGGAGALFKASLLLPGLVS